MVNRDIEITNMSDVKTVMNDHRIPYVHCEKIEAGHVKRVLRNCDSEKRMEIKNSKYIEKCATSKNIQGNMSYRETCKAYDDMILRLNMKNNAEDNPEDVAACYGLLVLSPQNLQPEDDLPFFKKVLGIITKQYEDVVQWYIHYDECAVVHMHCFVVSDCEIDTERLNNAVQTDALNQFVYPFSNGMQNRNP